MKRKSRLITQTITLIIIAACSFIFSKAWAEVTVNLAAVRFIESSGNPYAYNAQTKCYGLYQISEACLLDFNQIRNTRYITEDLFDPQINEMIASWYFLHIEEMLAYYNIPVSIATVIASYNWGIGNVLKWHQSGAGLEKLPAETRNYLSKYNKLTQ
jgi:soluble lytic murein transglycosylase-like protein